MRRFLLAVVACVGLIGCQTTAGPMKTKFSPEAAAFGARSGEGSVVGQAFLRQVGGGVVTAAGESVLVFPDQPYTRELVDRLRAGSSAAGEENPVRPFSRSTVADASGSFTFEGLAPGNYIVMTAVRWGAPSQYGVIPQGGVVARPVQVESGRVTKVIIN